LRHYVHGIVPTINYHPERGSLFRVEDWVIFLELHARANWKVPRLLVEAVF